MHKFSSSVQARHLASEWVQLKTSMSWLSYGDIVISVDIFANIKTLTLRVCFCSYVHSYYIQVYDTCEAFVFAYKILYIHEYNTCPFIYIRMFLCTFPWLNVTSINLKIVMSWYCQEIVTKSNISLICALCSALSLHLETNVDSPLNDSREFTYVCIIHIYLCMFLSYINYGNSQ